MIELPFAATAPRPGVAEALADASRSLELGLGEFIDSSEAEAKAIDRTVAKQFRKRFGRKPGDLTFESDLVVTTAGLFYVTPKAHHVWRREWIDLSLSVERPGRWSAKVIVTTQRTGKRQKFTIGARPAANLRVIAEYYGCLA